MTIEERVEFLHQSIESHDRQLGEITDQIRMHDRQLGEITDQIRMHDRQLGDLTVKFDSLTGMMAKLIETMQVLAETTIRHEHRLDAFEGRG